MLLPRKCVCHCLFLLCSLVVNGSSHNAGCCYYESSVLPKSPSSTLFGLENNAVTLLRGGGGWFFAGWNPFGYKITALGDDFLAFEGSRESDVGRFLASLKAKRTRKAALKDSWREIVRASKTAQAMRIYRQLDEFIKFCLAAGLLD